MKYRKKPVVIDAIQLTSNSIKAVYEFLGHKVNLGSDWRMHDRWDDYRNSIVKYGMPINTLEGSMKASMGDYIIKGIQGEFYPCKPDIFEQTYELVKEEDL